MEIFLQSLRGSWFKIGQDYFYALWCILMERSFIIFIMKEVSHFFSFFSFFLLLFKKYVLSDLEKQNETHSFSDSVWVIPNLNPPSVLLTNRFWWEFSVRKRCLLLYNKLREIRNIPFFSNLLAIWSVWGDWNSSFELNYCSLSLSKFHLKFIQSIYKKDEREREIITNMLYYLGFSFSNNTNYKRCENKLINIYSFILTN